MLDVCCVPSSYDEYIATVKTRNECQLSAYMLLLGNLAAAVCCAEVLFQSSFLVSLSVLPGVLHAEWSTKRTTEPDTAQTECVLTRLVDTASLDSRLRHSRKRVFARHPCIEPVLSCCLCQCCTHESSFLLSPHFAQNIPKPWTLKVALRPYYLC